MEEGKKWLIVISIGVVLTIALVVFYNSSDTKRLAPAEVREYQGKKLSSVEDFRENSIKGVQHINISDYTLEIIGAVENPKSYTYEEVLEKQNYEKVVTLDCVEGWSATILWKGVLVRDLLDEVEAGENAKEVIFYAYDGYSTAFPLVYFYDKDIIMAYEMNEVTVLPERGFPFVLVSEDKWGYKWIKWITKIEISDEVGYEGFWESRGYAREGNLNESFFA